MKHYIILFSSKLQNYIMYSVFKIIYDDYTL